MRWYNRNFIVTLFARKMHSLQKVHLGFYSKVFSYRSTKKALLSDGMDPECNMHLLWFTNLIRTFLSAHSHLDFPPGYLPLVSLPT